MLANYHHCFFNNYNCVPEDTALCDNGNMTSRLGDFGTFASWRRAMKNHFFNSSDDYVFTDDIT